MRQLRAWLHNVWRYRKFSGISDNAIMNPCGVVGDDAPTTATSLTVPHQALDQTACERGYVEYISLSEASKMIGYPNANGSSHSSQWEVPIGFSKSLFRTTVFTPCGEIVISRLTGNVMTGKVWRNKNGRWTKDGKRMQAKVAFERSNPASND